jgi:VanZ family protein
LQELMVRWCFQAAAWIAIAAITLLSIAPPSLRPTTFVPRKLEHLLIFGIAGLAFSLAYRANPLYQIIGMTALAGVLEVAQYWIPGRHARMSDFVINTIGVIIGVIVGRLVYDAMAGSGITTTQ